MTIEQIETVSEYADLLQVGARNMQNYPLLTALGHAGKPILLKRGMSATIQEWLMSAEYILTEGNPEVILCERGIRTFETATRNTLDLSAVPVIKHLSHLPIIVDPSHGVGTRRFVAPMARAAVAAGADGIMIEIHPESRQSSLRWAAVTHLRRIRAHDESLPDHCHHYRPASGKGKVRGKL